MKNDFFWVLLPTFLIILFATDNQVTYAQSDEQVQQLLIEIKTRMNVAVNQADKEILIEFRTELKKLTSGKKSDFWVLYYMAYADYRLSSLFPEMSKDQKERYLDGGIKTLEKVIKINPGFAEGWALLSICYGMKATGFFSGMKYGPKSQNTIDKALEIAPNNPRVVMVNAIGLLQKPGIVGGSTEKAIEAFKKAGILFDRWQPPGLIYPDWGSAENYVWLAQAYLKQDEKNKAEVAYKSALKISPDSYMIKEILLPELQEK